MTCRAKALIAASLLLVAFAAGGAAYGRFRLQRRAAIADREFVRTFESREPMHEELDQESGDHDAVYDDGRVIRHRRRGYEYMVVYDYETGIMKEYINNVLHSVLDVVEREKIAEWKAALTFSRSVTSNMTPTEVRSEEECIALSALLSAGRVEEIEAGHRGLVFQSEEGTCFVE